MKIPLKDNIQLKSESNSHNSQQNRVRSPKYKDLRISTQGHLENPKKFKENEVHSQQFKENRVATHSVIESIDRENKKKRNSNESNKFSKKSEFIKDDKLKEKLDKFAKTHLEKEDSVISNDKNSKNNVDWKLKRKEFMERKKTKKLEEETIIKITEIPIKKNKKTRWCIIF